MDRAVIPDHPHHVTQRGNGRPQIGRVLDPAPVAAAAARTRQHGSAGPKGETISNELVAIAQQSAPIALGDRGFVSSQPNG
jgi:hypothetical protein